MTCHGVTFMLGLYRFLCEVLRATEVMFAVNMFVHELCLRPRDCGILFKGAKRLWTRHTEAYYNPPGMKTNEQGQEVEAYPNERSCFTNLQREEIYSDHNGTWNIIDLPEVTVQARLIVHSVPCFGFSVTESDKSGTVAFIHDLIMVFDLCCVVSPGRLDIDQCNALRMNFTQIKQIKV